MMTLNDYLDQQLENPEFLAEWEAFERQRVQAGKVSYRSQAMRRVWAETTITTAMATIIRLLRSGVVTKADLVDASLLSGDQIEAIKELNALMGQGDLSDEQLAERFELPAELIEQVRSRLA